jgi:aldose 1-epimerase
MPPPPSGRQTVLARDGQEVVVVEIGGGLRTYRAGGAEVLDGYGEHDRCTSGRGQPLFPWPNRLDGGTYRFGDVEEHAPLTEPAAGNAIHGLTRWSPWALVDVGTTHATTGFVLRPQPGWAWTLELSVTYRLEADGLRVVTRAVNRGPGPCPFGAGFHPYLHAPSGLVDDLELTVPAASRYRADGRGIPVGREDVDGTSFDFRGGRVIGTQVMDVALTDLTRAVDGSVVVSVADHGSGRQTDLVLDRAWQTVMVFTGDTVGSRARQGLAIEPMTGPANLLRSGDGLVVLEPDEPWDATWSLLPRWL